MEKDVIVKRLKNNGYRMTNQRAILLDLFLADSSQSCKELYYEAAKIDSSIGFSTVYRLMNSLESVGAIEKNSTYVLNEAEGICNNSHHIDYHEIIECITCALDAKDARTAGHSKRVSDMCMQTAVLLGLDDSEVERIHIAAHLHDIGKIGVPDSILNKTGKLTKEEFEIIKKHPVIGAEILSKSERLRDLKEYVLHHHERFDGKGYPYGLMGKDIPLGARVIAICDSIDAITSDRTYHKAHSLDYCYEEISCNMAKMYDPDICREVLKNWEKITRFVSK